MEFRMLYKFEFCGDLNAHQSLAWNLVLCFLYASFVVDTHLSFAWNLVCFTHCSFSCDECTLIFRMIFGMHCEFCWGKWTLIFCEECNMLYTLELGGECTHIICAKSCICFTHSSLAVQWMYFPAWTFWTCFTHASLLVSEHWTLCRLHCAHSSFIATMNWCKAIFCMKMYILYTSDGWWWMPHRALIHLAREIWHALRFSFVVNARWSFAWNMVWWYHLFREWRASIFVQPRIPGPWRTN